MNGRIPKYSTGQVPSVPELIAFEAIARYKNFSKAADELSVTQSAISHRIQQLEARLGITLFHRQQLQTELTEAGELFLPHVQQILSSLENAITALNAKAIKRVRLSLSPLVGSHLVSHYLTAFQRDNPDIDLEITITASLANLRGGEADLGVRMGCDDDWQGLVKARFFEVALVSVCSPAYLKANPWIVSPENMLKATLLRQSIFSWKEWFLAQGFECDEPRRGPYYSDIHLLLQACELSQGIALLPKALVEHKIHDRKLVSPVHYEFLTDKSFYICSSPHALEQTQVQRLYDWLVLQASPS
ncbi:LysR substrate-binding domain-containing protein [Limnobacter alexandrii]|uniref:LysR substrate-binding domain-containing protein n=1 Tax=Limnobacter alexandrii TaxID=2570352 RepID=UPI0011085BC2|nr:LysR substrate-binding domain-containing protein [Limnobacter alexandrii]